MNDEVIDHPSHYNLGSIEVIDVIEAWKFGFHLGNVLKYIARAGHKNRKTELEDLRKAQWYLERHVKTRSEEDMAIEDQIGKSYDRDETIKAVNQNIVTLNKQVQRLMYQIQIDGIGMHNDETLAGLNMRLQQMIDAIELEYNSMA